MGANPQQSGQNELDADNDVMGIDVEMSSYESIVGEVIVMMAKLKNEHLVMVNGSADVDTKAIETAKNALKGNLTVSEQSRKVIEAFVDRTFKDEEFGVCSCEPGSFFGSLFGGLCN